MMKTLHEINIEKAMTRQALFQSLRDSREDIAGMTVREIAQTMRDAVPIEDLAAIMNELGEFTGEFTE